MQNLKLVLASLHNSRTVYFPTATTIQKGRRTVLHKRHSYDKCCCFVVFLSLYVYFPMFFYIFHSFQTSCMLFQTNSQLHELSSSKFITSRICFSSPPSPLKQNSAIFDDAMERRGIKYVSSGLSLDHGNLWGPPPT